MLATVSAWLKLVLLCFPLFHAILPSAVLEKGGCVAWSANSVLCPEEYSGH